MKDFFVGATFSIFLKFEGLKFSQIPFKMGCFCSVFDLSRDAQFCLRKYKTHSVWFKKQHFRIC